MNLDGPDAGRHLRALAETTPDAFVTIDATSEIQFVNQAMEDVLGYEQEELLGESLTVLMSDALAERHLEGIDRYLETGERHLDWRFIELPGRHKEGHEVPLEITFSEFTLDGERYFTGVLRDVSERKTLESERDLLHAAREETIQAESFDRGLENALRLLGESMNWVYGEAWVDSGGPDHLQLGSIWESDRTSFGAFAELSSRHDVEPGESLIGRVWETGEYEWIPDVTAVNETTFDRTAAAEAAGLKAALAIPIETDDTVVAVLVFLMPQEREVDERMVEVTRTIASNLGLLMARKRAEDALREERDLISAILETTPIGILIVDEDGTFSYANDRAEDLLRLDQQADGTYPSFGDLEVTPYDANGDPLFASDRPAASVLGLDDDDVGRDIQLEYPDGTRRWIAVHGRPLETDGTSTSTVFAFQDVTERHRRTDQLERLNDLGQTLSTAETYEAASEHVVSAATSILDLPVVTVARYDDETGSLRPTAASPAVEDVAIDGSLFPPGEDPAWEAFVREESQVYANLPESAGSEPSETPLGSVLILPIGSHGVFVGGSSEPGAVAESTVTFARILVRTVESAFDRLDRESSLRSRSAELETKNAQLRRVQRVNRQIRDITQALMGADSSAEIKQLVCDRLAAGEQYRFVWFGERDLSTDEIRPAASAGVDDGYLDDITVTMDEGPTGDGPAGRALETRSPAVQNNLQSDPPFEPWRQEAMKRDYRASIAVPVIYQDTLYGLLNLYSGEQGVFTDMEEAVLSELGEMVGYALNAMERYDALVSADSVELEFVIRDEENPLLAFLQSHEGRFRLENIGSRDSGTLNIFGAFENVTFDQIETWISRQPGASDLTLIRERNGETLVEASLPGDTFIARLFERGAIPTEIRATPEEGRMTIRISKSASVREYVEFFEDRYDDVELVARREESQPVQTEEEFERAYLDRLTERQHQVLQTAYFAGFFEQPRESTARDVAQMLDVSQPTVSRHIRSGEQTLFALLFDDEG